MPLTLLGVILLTAGLVGTFLLERKRTGTPPEAWHGDPASGLPRTRLWDARAWTARVRPGDRPANRGRHFRGRFWGGWVWLLLGSVLILIGGSALYAATDQVHVMGVTSLLAMTGVCWAFYRFVARQIAIDDTIGLSEMVAVTIAGAGATLSFALILNDAVISAGGVSAGARAVGFVEESAKLLVPLVLFALGKYRDPRAGIGLGLAAGFGFAIAETTLYAYETAAASGPDFCGDAASAVTTASVVQAQVARIFTVSPLHWLWTGVAVAIAWRLWHLYGRGGALGALGGFLLVMVIHSANDTSATVGCGNAGLALIAQVFRWGVLIGMYLFFKAMARKSTPPQLIGVVSRGWVPKHLKTIEDNKIQ